MRYDAPERPKREGVPLQVSGEPLPVITLVAPSEGACGAWLACIHASRGGNRFGYHSAVLPSLQTFSEQYLADPEATLARYFQYEGPERSTPERDKPALPDIWED